LLSLRKKKGEDRADQPPGGGTAGGGEGDLLTIGRVEEEGIASAKKKIPGKTSQLREGLYYLRGEKK